MTHELQQMTHELQQINPKRLEFTIKQREVCPYIPFIRSYLPDFVKVGKNVNIYEDVKFIEGFGYTWDGNRWLHIPHTGNIIIGDEVEIHPYTTIQRATVDSTIIGDGTKIDAHVHYGHNVKCGKNCIITAHTTICGSVMIGDNVWIGPGSCIRDWIKVGKNCIIGMGSVVTKDIPDGQVWAGVPAKEVVLL
jgi:UDP-3-O-[3-hydroxymyristoyl] glucosamine N-acyltransferase